MRLSRVMRAGKNTLQTLATSVLETTGDARQKLVTKGVIRQLVDMSAEDDADAGSVQLACDAVAHLSLAEHTHETRIRCLTDGAMELLVPMTSGSQAPVHQQQVGAESFARSAKGSSAAVGPGPKPDGAGGAQGPLSRLSGGDADFDEELDADRLGPEKAESIVDTIGRTSGVENALRSQARDVDSRSAAGAESVGGAEESAAADQSADGDAPAGASDDGEIARQRERRGLLALVHLVTRCSDAQRAVMEEFGHEWLRPIASDPAGGDNALRVLSLRLLGELAFHEANRVVIQRDEELQELVREAASGAWGPSASREACRLLHVMGPPSSPRDAEIMAASGPAGSRTPPPPRVGDADPSRDRPLPLLHAEQTGAFVPERGTRRILAIDGGGTRAVATIEMLKRIRDKTGREIHELFDLIAGTSTGAILAVMIGLRQRPLEDVEELYLEMAREVFWRPEASYTQTAYHGFRLLSLGEKYNHATLAKVLEEHAGSDVMVDAAVDSPGIPRVIAVASLVSQSPPVPYLFRSFAHRVDRPSRYMGTCQHRVWESLRASTAAPTFFVDVPLDGMRFIDGGILANNPTAIAVHEARRLWGEESVSCVVSLGTGGFVAMPLENGGWSNTVSGLIEAMTSTDVVHHAAEDLLPLDTYSRFNPVISPIYLDENDPEKLKAMQELTREYVESRIDDFDAVCARLTAPPPPQTSDLVPPMEEADEPADPSQSNVDSEPASEDTSAMTGPIEDPHRGESVFGSIAQRISNFFRPRL